MRTGTSGNPVVCEKCGEVMERKIRKSPFKSQGGENFTSGNYVASYTAPPVSGEFHNSSGEVPTVEKFICPNCGHSKLIEI